MCASLFENQEKRKKTNASNICLYILHQQKRCIAIDLFLFLSLDMETIGTYNGEKAFVVSLLIIVCDFVLGNRRPTIRKALNLTAVPMPGRCIV